MTESHIPVDEMRRFAARFGVPGFLESWLDRFFEPGDVHLVLAILETENAASEDGEGDDARRVPDAGGPPSGEGRPEPAGVPSLEVARRYRGPEPASWEDFLERARRRGVVDLLPDGFVRAADFHARYEIWALFEGWKDVPEEVRRRLNEWELAAYRERTRPHIEARIQGREPAGSLENEQYLLLHEAKDLIDRVERVYLWPCNCRAMEGRCDLPENVCLRFENDRGLGWEISRERAKEVLEEAARAGLMHTGEVVEVDGRVTGAICNCCADCCFPHQVAQELGAAKLWPRSRYVAEWDEGACGSCGRCARRCPFGAFVSESTEDGRLIRFDADTCRGCGVCVLTCPDGAIEMRPLDPE